MIRVFTYKWGITDPKRIAEMERCRNKNDENFLIDRIHRHEGNLSFTQVLAWMNQECLCGDIAILMTPDTYLDETVLHAREVSESECFVITRWEEEVDGSLSRMTDEEASTCQDGFIVRAPVRPVGDMPYGFGVAGGEGRLAYEMKKAGYTVTNPSLSIRFIHVHLSNIRPPRPESGIEPVAAGRRLRVYPCHLGGATRVRKL